MAKPSSSSVAKTLKARSDLDWIMAWPQSRDMRRI
jgi:hypothetical protein